MKKILSISFTVVLVVGLLLPGVPILAQDQRGTIQAPAVASADPLSGRLAADIQELRTKVDEDGRVTVVIKLAGQSLAGIEQARVIEELKRQSALSQRGVLALLDREDAVVLNTFWLTNAVLAEVPVGLLDALASLSEVERLVENFTILSPEPLEEESPAGVLSTGYTWGLEKIRAPEVWGELGVTGSGVRVAVLDTGVDMSHPDLAGKMWTDNTADPTYPGGWVEFDGSGNIVAGSTPHDTHGHGTHCSGTVLGGAASGTAIGVAPDAWLMHGLVLPGGGGTFTQVIAGMQWTIAPVDEYGNPSGEAADVISMSLGATGYYDVMREPVQNIRAAGIVPVIAIGNDGEGKSASPGNIRESFAIGATDIDDNVALFSGGAELVLAPEPYIKPDFSAPGVNVYSSLPHGKYGYNSGTSMATPHAAGIVALIREANPEYTVDEIYEVLKDTSVWYDLYYDERPCTRYGWGRIDAFDAVAIVLSESGAEGFVRDAETEEALEGAKLFISETNAVKSTDASGYYRFFLAPGNYTMSVGNFGYYEESITVEVVDACITQDFLLEPLPAGFIAGTVTDVETGQPVAGTVVTVSQTPLRVTTDEAGWYSVKVPTGTYDVNAWAWRYWPSLASDVVVPEGESVTVDLALEPGLAAVVVGDYYSQLTNLLMLNGISVEEKSYLWEAVWAISRYDVVVVNRPLVFPSEENFLEFLEAASAHGAGVVFTSCFPSYHQSYGITFLQMFLSDPEGQDHADGDGYVYYQVTHPNPIFEGWEVGDTITVIRDSEGGHDYHAWFWGYSGQAIAQVGSQHGAIKGDAVALNVYGDSLHILLASLGPRKDTDIMAWTEDAKTIFVNAVMVAGGLLETGLIVVSTDLPAGTVGVAYQATLNADGGTEPYTWAIIEGGLPEELELDTATGVVSGTPAAAGTFDFTVQVTDDEEDTAATGLSITIVDSLEIISTELPDGHTGIDYQATLEVAGGLSPYTWAIIEGGLPDGLGLGAATGVISGTPAAAGTFYFTVRVTDAIENTAAGELELIISEEVEDWLVNLSLTTDPHIGTVPGLRYTFAFGALDGASEGFDQAEGDQLAPGDPVMGVNAYFYYPDNPAGQRNLVTSVVGPEAKITWPLLVKSTGDPGDTQATLTWDDGDIDNVPAEYVTLELRDTAGNTLADMRSQGSYTFSLQSDEFRHFQVVAAGGHLEFVYELKAGWNMISLPLRTEETSPAKLLPGHAVIYAWDPVTLSYYVPTELVLGRGYWVLYFSDTTVAIHGVPLEQYELVDAAAGAHLIGSLEVEAQVTVTAGSVYSLYYWWNPETLSHEATDTLQPGKGYWLLGLTDFSIRVEPRLL